MIVFEAFAKELIHVYREHCNGEGVLPDSSQLMIWHNGRVINLNFNFYYDLIFMIMLGLKSYCAGIRCNNSDHAIAGRQAVAPLMFIGNHLIYQTLIINDMQIRVEAPPEVQEYIMKNESFSRSGDTYRGEGGDYITETENKHIKGHLSPGVPSIAHWIKASRNHEMLQRNRGSVFEKSSLKDPNLQESSIFRFDHEVQMLRCIIRDSGILAKPYDEIPLMALDRTYLHHDLVNFLFTARENYHKVLYNPDMEIKPVFVTYEDEKVYNDISTWKIEKIRRNIDAVLNELEDNDEYRNVYLRMKSANKQKLINFYEELKLAIKNGNAVR